MKGNFTWLALIVAGVVQADILTDVTVPEDGSQSYGYVKIGNDNGVKGSLTNNGQVSANQIDVRQGDIVNNNTMTDLDRPDDIMDGDFIYFNDEEGTFTNNGIVNGYVRMCTGNLVLNEGSYIEVLDVYEGVTVQLNGNVSMEYLYLDDNTEFIFTLGSSVDLNGGNFEFYNVNLVLLVDCDLTAGDVDTDYSTLLTQNLFTNFVNKSWESEGFTGDTVITLRDADGDEVTRTYSQVSANVPEAATATLSLLALCGLSARRRRK